MNLKDFIYAKTGLGAVLKTLADDPEGQALVASLMALVAKSDGGISPEETVRMVQVLQDRFHLSSANAVDLVARAADDFGTAADLDGLIVNMNEELSLSHKEELMSMVLHVIAADDRKHAAEMQLLATLIAGMNMPDDAMGKVYRRYFQEQKGRD